MHGDAGMVEIRQDANDSMADADMEDEYAQSPPAAEGEVHDAAISHHAAHGAPMHTGAPPPSPKSNPGRGSRAQGLKKRLRSDDAEQGSKKARRAGKPAFLNPEEIAALAQQRLAQQQLAAPQPPPAAPQPPPDAPQPPPAAPQPPPAAPQPPPAAPQLPPAAPQPPPAGAGQAQGPGQEQNNVGEQLGSALTGGTIGVRSAGVQSAWKPSF